MRPRHVDSADHGLLGVSKATTSRYASDSQPAQSDVQGSCPLALGKMQRLLDVRRRLDGAARQDVGIAQKRPDRPPALSHVLRHGSRLLKTLDSLVDFAP